MTIRTFGQMAAGLLVLLLAGCGSGAGVGVASGVGSGGTGIVFGTITGFGSVIIDGTRYPDSGASYDLTADSGSAVAVSPTAAGLGQRIEAEIDSQGNAKAVHIYPEVIGLVSAISMPTNTISVAGVQVVANATDPALPITYYAGYTQFGDIQVGDRVEVHGVPETGSTGSYVAASRIELKSNNCSRGCAVRVSGTLSRVDPDSQTFTLGALSVSYSGSTVIAPSGESLADGERVSVFSDAPLGSGTLNATSITIRRLDTAITGLRLSGAISDYASSASFSVAGVSVNAASAALTPASLQLGNGVHVIVSGNFDPNANQLLAGSVSAYSSGSIQTELHGTVTNFVNATNFQVRGALVDAGAAAFSGGTAADLKNNAYVEIHGTVSNNVVNAGSVAFVSEAPDSVDDLAGVIGGYTSPTQAFTLTLDNSGKTIQALLSPTPFYTGGSGTDLGNGKHVTVNATDVDGVWLVDTITFMIGAPPSGVSGANASANLVEVEGIASNVSVSAGSLTLNGLTVNYAGVALSGGGTLDNGDAIAVYGTLNGSVLSASQIVIDQDKDQD